MTTKLSAVAENERRRYVNNRNKNALVLVKKDKKEINKMTSIEEIERKEYVNKKTSKKKASVKKKFKQYLIDNGFINEIIGRY